MTWKCPKRAARSGGTDFLVYAYLLERSEHYSFEKWYANQVKYHKVTGEEPGMELKSRSFSPREISEMPGILRSITRQAVEVLIKLAESF